MLSEGKSHSLWPYGSRRKVGPTSSSNELRLSTADHDLQLTASHPQISTSSSLETCERQTLSILFLTDFQRAFVRCRIVAVGVCLLPLSCICVISGLLTSGGVQSPGVVSSVTVEGLNCCGLTCFQFTPSAKSFCVMRLSSRGQFVTCEQNDTEVNDLQRSFPTDATLSDRISFRFCGKANVSCWQCLTASIATVPDVSSFDDIRQGYDQSMWTILGLTSLAIVACTGTAGATASTSRFHKKRLEVLLKGVQTARNDRRMAAAEQRQCERLLDDMLPVGVAARLKAGRRIEPETFDVASVYFSDIVGFNDIALSCESPLVLVQLLNEVFSAFDSCTKKYRVYKVETIGDSYVVTSGLPDRIGDQHAREMANLALHLLAVSADFSLPGHDPQPLPLRIGINCGSVVAGVIGLKNPRYCLFGDTVNTASRMESTGKPYMIHCSEAFMTSANSSEEFMFEERGTINVKGKGSMKTFWLMGRRDTVVVKATPSGLTSV